MGVSAWASRPERAIRSASRDESSAMSEKVVVGGMSYGEIKSAVSRTMQGRKRSRRARTGARAASRAAP